MRIDRLLDGMGDRRASPHPVHDALLPFLESYLYLLGGLALLASVFAGRSIVPAYRRPGVRGSFLFLTVAVAVWGGLLLLPSRWDSDPFFAWVLLWSFLLGPYLLATSLFALRHLWLAILSLAVGGIGLPLLAFQVASWELLTAGRVLLLLLAFALLRRVSDRPDGDPERAIVARSVS